ncbi:MAG: NADH-quinone oxidoreductase subunit I [Candidatus Dormibacteria bacterium]
MSVKGRKSLPGLGLVRSVGVSFRHIFERKQTVSYPDQAAAVGFRFRGRHIFHQDVCIGCTQCERVCPVIAIKMETHKDPTSRKVVTDRFALDLGICYYCGLCEEVCPTDPKAVHLGPDFELATHDRRLLIYEMDQLTGPKPLPSKPKPAARPEGAPAAAPAKPAAAAPPTAETPAAAPPAAETPAPAPVAPPAAETPAPAPAAPPAAAAPAPTPARTPEAPGAEGAS